MSIQEVIREVTKQKQQCANDAAFQYNEEIKERTIVLCINIIQDIRMHFTCFFSRNSLMLIYQHHFYISTIRMQKIYVIKRYMIIKRQILQIRKHHNLASGKGLVNATYGGTTDIIGIRHRSNKSQYQRELLPSKQATLLSLFQTTLHQHQLLASMISESLRS